MSDSGSSSASSATDSPRGGSPEPLSLPASETEPGPADEGQVISETDQPTDAEPNVPIPEPEPEPEAHPDAKPLHITWKGVLPEPSEGETPPPPSIAVDLVVVHGVYGNWEDEAQAGPGSGGSEWVTGYAESLNSESRILRFEYDALQLFSGHRSREAIRSCALKLLRALSAVRQNETKKRLIMFVAHDIGGIIVKDALAVAALDTASWQDLFEMSRILLFTGCPHRSANSLDMEETLCRFLYADYDSGIAAVRPSASSIAGLATAVVEINGLFVESKVPLRSKIISIYSRPDCAQSINQVFDSYSGTLGIPLEKRFSELTIGDNHFSVLDYLGKLANDLNITVEAKQHKFERKLLSLASPIHPFQTAQSDNPLAESDQYKAWLDHSGAQMLYIHGTHRVREASEQVFYAVNDHAENRGSRASVLYFSFDRWDVRCDSIRDMLSTFLAQIICQTPSLSEWIEALYTRLDHERGWTEADLVYWFERFRYALNGDSVMCVINYFDECTKGSRKLFLDTFAYFSQASEGLWKVVVTSHKPGTLLEELSDTSCVILNLEESGLETQYAADFEKDMTRLLKLRPELLVQDSLVRKELQSVDGLEPLAQHIIHEQARVRREWPDETSIQELFESLKLVPDATREDDFLEQLLEWVLRKIPEQETLRRVLPWLLYAVRPLTIWELATVIYLGSEHDKGGHASPSSLILEDLISKVQTWFAGIIEIDQNEIKVRHPRLRNILMGKSTATRAPGGSKFLWEEVEMTAHFDIANLCLDYLSRPGVLELLDKTFQVGDPEAFEAPIFADRETLCAYAVQAWMHHSSLGSPTAELTKLLPQEGSSDLAHSWARGYWALSNPVTRSTAYFGTLFPIFAGLGILGVVEPRDEKDAHQGILEAAIKGQFKTVQALLEKFKFSESELLDILVAAASSGDEMMLLELVDYITRNSTSPDSIPWPPVLVFRAAWLGLDRFADKLLQLGCSADPNVEWMSIIQTSPLGMAARNFHAETVRVLLRHGANINFRNDKERTPLHLVADQGYAEIAKILVEDGKIDLEVVDDSGFTPLYLAALWGHHRVVETLLQIGADPNMGIQPDVNSGKWSPLVVASDDGYKRSVELLLEKKANPNISGPTEIGTPLRYAAVKGHMDICNMLLASGADPNSSLISPPILIQVVNDQELSANQLEVLDLLLSHNADLNAKDSDGTPVLIHAVRSKDEDIVRRLLDHGADVNALDSVNNGALYYAASDGSLDLVKLLLEKNAAVNAVNENGVSPLYFAVPDPEITRVLLEKGADPDLSVNSGFTALMFAAWSNHITSLELLLKHNATVDMEYGDDDEYMNGWTALTCAATYGSEDGIRILVENGADLRHKSTAGVPILHVAAPNATLSGVLEFPSKIDLDVVDKDGKTALHLSGVSITNVKRLVNAGASLDIQDTVTGDTPLTMAAYSGDLELVQYLFKHGASINLGSPADGTALHQACRKSHMDIMKFLVENGADVNQPCDGLPGTPLQAACMQFSSNSPRLVDETVNYLLEHGADVTVEGGLLGYAINTAALAGTPSLINLFLDKGAKVNVSDSMGRMPIHLAAFNGIENFEVILDAGGNISDCDKTGRTALHWAVQPGRLQVVEKIISLLPNKEAIDAPDIDGWTPLCWAARGTVSWMGEELPSEPGDQLTVMRLLIEKGANRSVIVSVGDQKWTPLKIARYSGQSSEVIELLKHGLNPKNAGGETENGPSAEEAEEDKSKTANEKNSYCDACLCAIRGFAYTCKSCFKFDFCFKCYPRRELIHTWPDHLYEPNGPEWDNASEAEANDDEDDAHSESSASSDSDSD